MRAAGEVRYADIMYGESNHGEAGSLSTKIYVRHQDQMEDPRDALWLSITRWKKRRRLSQSCMILYPSF